MTLEYCPQCGACAPTSAVPQPAPMGGGWPLTTIEAQLQEALAKLEFKPVDVSIKVEREPERLKGKPWRVFSAQSIAALSDMTIDCQGYNALNVQVYVTGTSPSATVSVEGSDGGAGYMALSDVNAKQHTVTAARSFDVQIGSAFAKIRLADLAGTFGANQGYTVVCTPFVMPAQDQPIGRLVTLRSSAAQTVGTVTGDAVALSGHYRRFIALLAISASATDAGDTLDVYVDFSLDGSTWVNAIHFTQQAGDGAAASEVAILDPSAPGTAVVAVTADAASGAVRPAVFGPYVRYRGVVVNVSAADASHTYSLILYAQ